MRTYISQRIEVREVEVALVALRMVRRIPEMVGPRLHVGEVVVAQGAVKRPHKAEIHSDEEKCVVSGGGNERCSGAKSTAGEGLYAGRSTLVRTDLTSVGPSHVNVEVRMCSFTPPQRGIREGVRVAHMLSPYGIAVRTPKRTPPVTQACQVARCIPMRLGEFGDATLFTRKTRGKIEVQLVSRLRLRKS